MICRMCLMDSLEVLDIFAGERTASNTAAMIAQHFWFEPKYDDQMSNVVCVVCWRKIKSFHEYYLHVEEAQWKLSGRLVNRERQEQESLEQHADAGTRKLVQIGPEESDEEMEFCEEGGVITVIEVAHEKKSEEDGNSGNRDNSLNEELRLEAPKESKEFVKIEPEESDEKKDADEDGGVITVIEVADEKMSEEDDNNENRDSSLNEEIRHESSKESRFYEDMIEEVKSYLFDEIPERSLTGSRNEDYIIKIEPTDPTSDSNVVNVESDDGNYSSLLSMRRYPKEPHSTDQTQGKETRLDDNYVATEEEALQTGRHVQVASELSEGIKQFLKFELEDSNEGNYARLGDGCAIKVMEYAAEHKLEPDYVLDNEAIVYNYFIKEEALESTKPIGVDEGLIEEVKASLYDDMPEQIVIGDPEVQTNADELIKVESVDSDSKEHIVNLDDGTPLESLRLGQIEIGTTHLTNKPERQSLQEYKEDDQVIARHIELKCDLCGGNFATFAEISQHVNEIHGKLGYVKCCNQKLIKKSEVLDHLHKHFGSDSFKCSKCNKSYSDKQGLNNHLSRHEMLETQMHCANCFKWFKNQYSMKQHICPSLTSIGPCFSCKICWGSFASETLLEAHRQYVHKPKIIEGETLFPKLPLEPRNVVEQRRHCDKCGTWLKNSLHLKLHTKRIHRVGKSTKRKEFACKICGKRAVSNERLIAHMKNMHEPQLTFVCSVCGKGFNAVRNLQQHMAGHTEEPLDTCLHCPRNFESANNMYERRKSAPIEM